MLCHHNHHHHRFQHQYHHHHRLHYRQLNLTETRTLCQCNVKNLAPMCLFNTNVIDDLVQLINQPKYTRYTFNWPRISTILGENQHKQAHQFLSHLCIQENHITTHIPFSSILNTTNKVGRIVVDFVLIFVPFDVIVSSNLRSVVNTAQSVGLV